MSDRDGRLAGIFATDLVFASDIALAADIAAIGEPQQTQARRLSVRYGSG
jgi:hypothetical protein